MIAYENYNPQDFDKQDDKEVVCARCELLEKHLRHLIGTYMVLDDFTDTQVEMTKLVDSVMENLMKIPKV